jgi:2-keto-myo-inositol isomerase
MKLGFHGATTMTSDLETDIEVACQAGFYGLELWGTKVDKYLKSHSLADLKALLQSQNVRPIAYNSIEFIAFRGSEYPQIQQRCRDFSRICQAIDCPTVVVVPSPTPNRDMPWSDVEKEYVTVLRDLSSIAGEFGVRLAFEFLGFGWCSVRTPRAAWEIVQKTDRANVGMNFDAAHFYGGGGLLSEIDPVDPAKLFAFHLDDVEDIPKEAITDATRLMPGMGVVPLGDICKRLKGIGYDGVCSVELFRPEYWAWDPAKVARTAHESAVKVLSPYFKVG